MVVRLRRTLPGNVNRRPARQRSDEPKKGRSNRLLNRFLNVLLLLAVGLVLVYSILLTGQPKVDVRDQIYRPKSVYQSAVQTHVSFFNKTKLTYSGSSLAERLKKKFPEVNSVSYRFSPFSTSPTIKLSVSKPVFIIHTGSGSYLVDGEGVAVIPTTMIKKEALVGLSTVQDQSGLSPQPGKQVLSAGNVNFISQLLTQLKAAKVPISSLTLPPLSEELDLKTSDEPYFVKFYLGGDANLEAGQLLAARHSFAKKNIHPKQYLDVRVAGKIFFK